jgi:hypothetical protein
MGYDSLSLSRSILLTILFDRSINNIHSRLFLPAEDREDDGKDF